MIEPIVDGEAFKKFEHEGWQNAVGQYHDSFSSLSRQTIEPLLDAVHVDNATTLLDIATGPGYVAAAAQRRGAKVIGLDFSEAMLTKAKQLYPSIDFVLGDAEALQFSNGKFDAAVMNFGLLHLGRPEVALAEAFRVIKPNGTFGFTVWTEPQDALGFKIVLQAIEAYGNATVPLPQGPPFFRFSDHDECVRALTEAGFKEVSVLKLPLLWKLQSADELFEAFFKGTPRTGGILRAQSSNALVHIRAAIHNATKPYENHGGLQIPMMAIVTSAIKR